jgi:hypothetical protein
LTVYRGLMACSVALRSRLLEERDEPVVCRSVFQAHGLSGDRSDQVLALLRACGLRFRDGARWRLQR